jgi:hypothetical protein
MALYKKKAKVLEKEEGTDYLVLEIEDRKE